MTVRRITGLLGLALMLASCGRAGDADAVACLLCGPRNDVKGSIANQNGSQAQMQGWVVAAFETDTGIARVSEVDAAGLYTLQQMRTDRKQTLALLSPDYILQSVLSIPSTIPNTIRQFFMVRSPHLPKLIHKGPIITFQDFNGILITKDLATDQDGNQVPDGAVQFGAALTDGYGLQGSTVDLDQDRVPNDKDPDIDGDGLINWLDPDDNNNNVLDVFDPDQNGDLVPDTAQSNLDMYFPEGLEFVSVQFTLRPKDDGTGNETSLTFVTKVRKDVTPLAVQVRGAPSLLNGATYTALDTEGNPTKVAWNRLLADDGLSEDASAGDRLFGRKVILDAAKSPRAHEVVFFQLVFGTAERPWFMEFPYAFPPLKPAPISAQYEPNMRNVLLVGTPFGPISDYIWSINLYNADGKVVWASPGVPGLTRQFAIPENQIMAGETYTFSVVAQVLDKVQGYPTYTIHSPKYELR